MLSRFTILVALASLSVAGTVRADSTVDAVTVFPDRAEVTRTQKVACGAGKAVAVFAHLPASLDPLTLRGDVRGGGEVIGLASEITSEVEAVDDRVRALDEDLRKVRAQIQSVTQVQASVREAGQNLIAYEDILQRTLAQDMREPRPALPRLAKNLDAFRAKRVAMADRIR